MDVLAIDARSEHLAAFHKITGIQWAHLFHADGHARARILEEMPINSLLVVTFTCYMLHSRYFYLNIVLQFDYKIFALIKVEIS